MITDTETSKNWMLFERFKMHLYDSENTFSNIDVENIDYIFETDEDIEYKVDELKQELPAANGMKYSSELVFIEAFKYIHQECKRYLKKHKIKVSNDEIEWILTVPSIWNDKAKYKMKKWAEKASLFKYSEQCRIVYEPDAASIFIQHELYYKYIRLTEKSQQAKHGIQLSESKSTEFDQDGFPNNQSQQPTMPHIGNLSRLLKHDIIDPEEIKNEADNIPKFEKGMQYILIDGGGGTVDIACHEIVGEFGVEMGVKEVLPPTGILHGIFSKNQFELLRKSLYCI